MDGESGFENEQGSVTPDGRTLIFVKRRMSDKSGDIMTVPVDGSAPASALMTTLESETHPRLSPSGDLLAYLVHKDQRPEGVLKVVAYPKPAEPLQVSIASDVVGCRWMGAGELCWIDAAGRCWSATLTREGRAEVSPPRPMFDGKAFDPQTRFLDYDAARDRFLIATMEEATEAPEFILVSDWRQGVVGAAASPR